MKHDIFVYVFNTVQYKTQLFEVLKAGISQEEKLVIDLFLAKFIDSEWSL